LGGGNNVTNIITADILVFLISFIIIILGIHEYLKIKEKNIVIDIYIPCFLILLPILLYQSITYSFFLKLIIFFLMHVFVMLLLIYLNQIRNWNKKFREENENVINISEPIFLLHLSFALGYIYYFIILVFVIRYLNLGMAKDLSPIYFYITHPKSLPFYILLYCYLPLIYWFLLQIINLKNILWNQLTNFYYSLHLFFIQKKRYFLICQYLYKFIVLYNIKIVTKNYILKKYKIFFQNHINLIFLFFLFSLFIFETYFYKSIFYFYYGIFVFMIVKIIEIILISLNQSNWVFDVCKSDYIYK
jgi:hypothetical protein